MTSPPASPTPSAAATLAATGQPRVRSAAAVTPASDAIEPTERSKSPAATTTVIVAAITASMLTWWAMFSQFRAVRNVPGKSAAKTATRTRIASGAARRRSIATGYCAALSLVTSTVGT